MIVTIDFNRCKVCGELKSKRIHRRCSKIMQKQYNEEEAKRITKAQKEYEYKRILSNDLNTRIRNRMQ